MASRPLHEDDPQRTQTTIDPECMRICLPNVTYGAPQVSEITAVWLDNEHGQHNTEGQSASGPHTHPMKPSVPSTEQHMAFLSAGDDPVDTSCEKTGPCGGAKTASASGARDNKEEEPDDDDSIDIERTYFPLQMKGPY